MKKAFTLIEVNLAMLIMAVGILAVMGLYSFGYRESRQSREDVAATALADLVVGQLMTAVTSPNVSWTAFNSLENYPGDDGWGEYINNSNDGMVKQNPHPKAKAAFDKVLSVLSASGVNGDFPSDDFLKCGLVIRHEKNSPIVKIAFRATKQASTLLSMPIFYSEGHFQGVFEEGQQSK